MTDWSKCPAVESVPGRLSGAWVFTGTRLPVSSLFENLESGATVEELLHPKEQPELPMDLLLRYNPAWVEIGPLLVNQYYWLYRMINTTRPLEEKICLFWHSIFCVGDAKCMNGSQIKIQLDKFRGHGLGRFPELLLQLASDPAMIYYLDNCMSHKDAINENWGRELLELFSLGVGMDGHPNYTEEDVKACARAFAGWTHRQRRTGLSLWSRGGLVHLQPRRP